MTAQSRRCPPSCVQDWARKHSSKETSPHLLLQQQQQQLLAVQHYLVPQRTLFMLHSLMNSVGFLLHVGKAAKGSHHAPGTGPHAGDKKSKSSKGSGATKKGVCGSRFLAICNSYANRRFSWKP
jgi:hypothetical protein